MKKEEIKIVSPDIKTVEVTIEGLTSLLCHRKTAEGIKKKAVQEKDEDKIFKACLYPKINGNYTFPSGALRKCAIQAAHTVATSVPKTKVRASVFIPIEWIPIIGEPNMRKDMVNPRPNITIIVIRAEFKKWEMTFPIQYDANGPLSLEVILNLFELAGHSIGIGPWRPERGGGMGRFRIKRE